MSFVDLMGDAVWSRLDIERRVYAEVEAQFPGIAEVAERVTAAQMLGPNAVEPADRDRYLSYLSVKRVCPQRIAAAVADNELLQTILAVLRAKERTLVPVPEGLTEEELAADAQERAAAQAVVDAATADVLAIVDVRLARRSQ